MHQNEASWLVVLFGLDVEARVGYFVNNGDSGASLGSWYDRRSFNGMGCVVRATRIWQTTVLRKVDGYSLLLAK